MNSVLITALEAALKLQTMGHRAVVVGGAIRDTLLCREVRDADIATSATMDDIVSVWPSCKVIGSPPLATALLVLGGVKLDIASFQGRDLAEDLGRRDLTINSMAMTPGGEIIDPWDGLDDISFGLLRFTRDPVARLKEDPLRALRLARFASTLPHFSIDPASAEACPEFALSLTTIPLPRIGREILFSLDGDLLLFLELLETLGILEASLPFVRRLDSLTRNGLLRRVELTGKMTGNRELRAASLLADAGEKAKSIAVSWGWGRPLMREIESFGKWRSLTYGGMTPELFGDLFRAKGSKWIDRLFLLGLADCLVGHREQMKTWTLNRVKASEYSFRLASFSYPLVGEDIIRVADIKSSPLVGEVISAVYGAIAEGCVKDRENALEWVRTWIEENRPGKVL